VLREHVPMELERLRSFGPRSKAWALRMTITTEVFSAGQV
jgi:hypothetical protein